MINNGACEDLAGDMVTAGHGPCCGSSPGSVIGRGSFGVVVSRNGREGTLFSEKRGPDFETDTLVMDRVFGKLDPNRPRESLARRLSMGDELRIAAGYVPHVPVWKFWTPRVLRMKLFYGNLGALLIDTGIDMSRKLIWVRWLILHMSTALRKLHEMGILHRDISLKNIFVDDGCGLVLGDFGAAVIPPGFGMHPSHTAKYPVGCPMTWPPEFFHTIMMGTSTTLTWNPCTDFYQLHITLILAVLVLRGIIVNNDAISRKDGRAELSMQPVEEMLRWAQACPLDLRRFFSVLLEMLVSNKSTSAPEQIQCSWLFVRAFPDWTRRDSNPFKLSIPPNSPYAFFRDLGERTDHDLIAAGSAAYITAETTP